MINVKKLMFYAMAGAALLMASHAQAAYIGTDAGYSGSQIGANFRSVSAQATVFVGDDDYTSFTLPFDFTFYGHNYAAGSLGWVSVNGLLGFDPDNANDYCCNAAHSYGLPLNTIRAGWFDLYGSVSTQTDGAAGNREFVFTWDGNEFDLPSNGDNDGAVNRFQVILREFSTDIEFQYAYLNVVQNLDPEPLNSHFVTAGAIKGEDASLGLAFIDFEQGVHLSDVGLLIRYDPLAAPGVPEPGSVALIGLGLAALVLLRRKTRRASIL